VCVEEAAAGDLLDAMQAALYLRQNPALRIVVLEGPGHDIEIALLDLMRIKEAWAYGLYDCDNSCTFLVEVGVGGRGIVLMDSSVIAICITFIVFFHISLAMKYYLLLQRYILISPFIIPI